MKKINLLFLFLLASYALSYGKEVPVTTAQTVGYNYLQQRGAPVNSATDLHLAYTSGSSTAYFYVFNGNNCFVIVSADDAVTPVLGYSKSNTFRADNMPSNLTYLMDNYTNQISYVISHNANATTEIATNWDNLINNKSNNAAAKTTTVSPMLTTTWDQYPYYNAYCPADAGASMFGGTDVTGCVATAMAQVMKFWNWPITGVGSHSYSTSSYGTLSANFGATTYNWSSMPNNVSSSNPAVATLMYHAGVSVNMQYTASESGSYVISSTSPITNCAEYALKNYFNYKSTMHGYPRSSYSDATWISMLKSDLDAGHPIIYDGTGSAGGHCFVFDGYDASSNFHVNWGWSGASNGYYTIDALNPPALGAGGGGGGFNSDQEAIFGIEPNSGTVVATGMVLASPLTASTTIIPYGSTFNITTSVYNGGSTAFSGSYAALVTDASGTLIDSVQVLAGSLAAGATSGTLTFTTSGLLSMLPGTYNIAVYYRNTGSSWVLVGTSTYSNSTSITVYNSDPMELADGFTLSPSPLVQGSPATVNVNFYNGDVTDFTGDFDVSLYNLDGTYACGIQTLTGMSLASGYEYSSDLTFTTSSITAAPGTYLLAAQYIPAGGTSSYLAGADYYQNPILVTVVAPALSPDMYEVDNTAATAYTLPLTYVSNVATKSTTGANFHITSDQDYYKVVLPAGYNYSITARVNDAVSTDDGLSYTVDAVWSYSTDGGATWSSTYNDVMTGTINLTGYTGGSVIFHVSPHYAGNTGTYILKLSNVTRTVPVGVPELALSAASVYPNPASDVVTIDLSGTDAKGITAMLTDMQGKTVYTADVNNETTIKIPVNNLPAGMYFLQVATDAGIINKKITVAK